MSKNMVIVQETKESRVPEVGSLWVDSGDGEVYMLASITPKEYVAISLNDGNRFRNPYENITYAVEGLEFLGRDAKIIVEVPNGYPQS